MPDVSDMELLRDYDRQGLEEAFAELVRRHINLVYSVALRHVRVAAHAEEITQAVFVILARKAAGLRPDTILEGWLHETTRLTALSFLRGERRRQFREQEAYMPPFRNPPMLQLGISSRRCWTRACRGWEKRIVTP
jgi:DNA-directed RNA polymerase specialized sigma24 family protein